MSDLVTMLHGAAIAILGLAALLSLYRLAAGPSGLDRSIASDVLVATIVAATGLFALVTGQETVLPVLVVLSVLGFTGAVSMARLLTERSAQVRELPASRAPGRDGAGDGAPPVVLAPEDGAPRDGVRPLVTPADPAEVSSGSPDVPWDDDADADPSAGDADDADAAEDASADPSADPQTQVIGGTDAWVAGPAQPCPRAGVRSGATDGEEPLS